MAYQMIGWENAPSKKTPINDTNLKHMDKGIFDNDAAIASAKVDIEALKTEAQTLETKVETLAPKNFELYAISDTQPTIPIGESYYNTTSNKIFTNVDDRVYVDKGEPEAGMLYIIFSDQSTYAYNGTTLVSVGGGSGSSDIVVVPTETPTEDTKLQIESDDFTGMGGSGTDITNQHSESTALAYSCDYSNGHFQEKIEKGRIPVSSMSTFTVGSDTLNHKEISFAKQYTNIPIVLVNVGTTRARTYYGFIGASTRAVSTTGCDICINVDIHTDTKTWVDYIVIPMD